VYTDSITRGDRLPREKNQAHPHTGKAQDCLDEASYDHRGSPPVGGLTNGEISLQSGQEALQFFCDMGGGIKAMRFESEGEIDAFTEALGLMLVEFASAYKVGDPSFDAIGDTIEYNVSQLADLAKVGLRWVER
jgi:hypothetical protein